MSEVVKLLRANNWFQNQPEAFFEGFSQLLKQQDVRDGDVLIKQGEHVEKLFLLEKGTLVRTRDGEKEPLLIDEVPTGHTICFLHLFNEAQEPAFATVSSRGGATVWQAPKADVQKFFARDSKYSLPLMAALAAEVRAGSKILRVLSQQHKTEEGSAVKVIKMVCFDATNWTRDNFSKGVAEYNKTAEAEKQIHVTFTTDSLSADSASHAAGNDVACLFVNDDANQQSLMSLSNLGIKMIAMRCAGYDRVDTGCAESLGLTVARVPAYSPYAVAEHAVTLLMSLNRRIHKAVNRVQDHQFTLDGLMGFDLHGKTVAVVGTGKIGVCLCNILLGFGVNLLCYDPHVSEDLKQRGAKYVEQDEIWGSASVVFLMTPLFEATHHLFNKKVLPKLKKGMVLINTSRGGLVETEALIEGLRSGVIGGAGVDVYENESPYFFKDCSQDVIQDTQLTELLAFPNVIMTAHQAFFTQEAIDKIVSTTLDNVKLFMDGKTGRDHPNTFFG